jgi:hypothetical protein
MVCTTFLVCLVSTVSGCHKNALGRGNTCIGRITKLEQSTFLGYLWLKHSSNISLSNVAEALSLKLPGTLTEGEGRP